MKIQNTQTNVSFGNYAVLRKGVERGLKPLGMEKREARQFVGGLIQQFATSEGDELLVFNRSRLNPNKTEVTLVGTRIAEPSKASTLASGSPVEITLPIATKS